MGFNPSQTVRAKQNVWIWFLNHQLLAIGFFAFQGSCPYMNHRSNLSPPGNVKTSLSTL